MAGKSRKISFYRLSIEKSVSIPRTRTHRIISLTNEDIESNFKIIHESTLRAMRNGHKVPNAGPSCAK